MESDALTLQPRRLPDRVVDFILRIDPAAVLNSGPTAERVPDVGRALKEAANAMRSEAIDLDSGEVDYERLAQSEAYAHFRQLTLSLPHCSRDDLGSVDSQLAFWINVYNALILDAIVRYSMSGSLLSDLGFFRRAAYNIGGFRFSADDIEHGVLRRNRKHPYLPFRPFAKDDPRGMLQVERFDPRIHFALVCGAKSCPPISFYEGDRIDAQLDQAAGTFIRGEGARLEEGRTLWLSRIFQWYENDFGGREGVLNLVTQHLNGDSKKDRIQDLRMRYLPYDWSVNAKV